MFEKEQIAKKKLESFQITQQKLMALKHSVEKQFMDEPQMIGCIPGLHNQENVAFDYWLNRNKALIITDPEILDQLEFFIEQLTILKADPSQWRTFLTRWKLYRIMYDNQFPIVWEKVKENLSIQFQPNDGADDFFNDEHREEQKEEKEDEELKNHQEKESNTITSNSKEEADIDIDDL